MKRPVRGSAGDNGVEARDEWQVADKRYLSEATLALLNKPSDQGVNLSQQQPLSRHS